MSAAVPRLSVILYTPDNFEDIRHTVRHLQAQTAREQLEVIIVAPVLAQLGLDEAAMTAFGSYVLLESGSTEVNSARAMAFHTARAPIVVLGEDHSFPQTEWAEALIEAHAQPYAAVGVEMGNALPDSLWGWVEHTISFGQWMEQASPGLRATLPGHNTSYKRDMLLSYGDTLGYMLKMEMFLHHDLVANGRQLFLEPRARTLHLGFTIPSHILAQRFWAGRYYGALRSREWGLGKRLIYILASPLIPFLRLKRSIEDIRRARQTQRLLPRIVPLLFLALVVDAFGEVLGYIGDGRVLDDTEDEFHRLRHIHPHEREAFTNESSPH